MMEPKERLNRILPILKRKYRREMQTALEFSSPWQLLLATILSAQAQDAQVNKATKKLFRVHPEIGDYAGMTPKELYRYTKTIGLYRAKSKNIIKAARMLKERFNSIVPSSIEELTTLPGVGRKTANVVMANAHGINEGIAIDTHCITVANRLGLVRTKNPIKIEKRLMRLAPKDEWCNVNHLFIALGRDACTARRKYCSRCVLKEVCPSSDAR